MGVELLILGGLMMGAAHIKGKQQQNQYEDQAEIYAQQANVVATEGAIKARERSKQIARLGSQQKTSFLQSGITLQGTPMNVLSDTYKTGREDIDLTKKNYEAKTGSLIAQANQSLKTGRSAYQQSMLDGVMSVGTMAVMGGVGGGASGDASSGGLSASSQSMGGVTQPTSISTSYGGSFYGT